MRSLVPMRIVTAFLLLNVLIAMASGMHSDLACFAMFGAINAFLALLVFAVAPRVRHHNGDGEN